MWVSPPDDLPKLTMFLDISNFLVSATPKSRRNNVIEEKRWYAKQTGRWHRSIEIALAGTDRNAINLAWALLASVGGGHRCQTEFGLLVDWPQNQVSNYLRGRTHPPDEILERAEVVIREKYDAPFLTFGGVEHPLEIGMGASWYIPGDIGFDLRWKRWSTSIRDNPPLSEVKERFPNLFPLE